MGRLSDEKGWEFMSEGGDRKGGADGKGSREV